MAAESTIARLKFDTVCSLDGLRQGMRQAAQVVQTGMGRIGATMSTGGGFGGLGKAFGSLGFSMPSGLGNLVASMMNPATLGLGALAGGTGMLEHYAGQAKQLQMDSQRLGMGVEQYQALSKAARRTGSDIGVASMSLQRMRRSIADANGGNEQLRKTYQAIGVDSRKLFQMDTGKQLEEVARGLAGIGNATERARTEMAIFGRGGAQLDPMLMGIARKGLSGYGSAFHLTSAETNNLAAMKYAIPAFGLKAAAGAVTGLGFGANASAAGMGQSWLVPGKGAAEESSGPRGFGQLALAGTQEAYAASIAWKYGLEDKNDQQIALLQQIASNTENARE